MDTRTGQGHCSRVRWAMFTSSISGASCAPDLSGRGPFASCRFHNGRTLTWLWDDGRHRDAHALRGTYRQEREPIVLDGHARQTAAPRGDMRAADRAISAQPRRRERGTGHESNGRSRLERLDGINYHYMSIRSGARTSGGREHHVRKRPRRHRCGAARSAGRRPLPDRVYLECAGGRLLGFPRQPSSLSRLDALAVLPASWAAATTGGASDEVSRI